MRSRSLTRNVSLWNQNIANSLGIPPRSYTRRNKRRYARFIDL